ncbi:class I SAM-dependent methyltransferase [Rhodobacteraceae bacterium KMM 6894]|nr:class I SAM-dependent methyltransferase [Rhodobacteraceae bacterium KMM 6894]
MSIEQPATALDVIARALNDGACATLLDVGCGAGRLKRHVENLGVIWTGVDPAAPVAGSDIHRAGAEALPFDAGAFDAVLFLNSLHHVPTPLMDAALCEALRVLARSKGPVIVIEPDIDGALSEALRRVDDETQIRTAAQAALGHIVATGRATRQAAYSYMRHERYQDFADFTARLSAADATRAASIRRHRAALEDDFHRLATRDDNGLTLCQPMNVCLLRPA